MIEHSHLITFGDCDPAGILFYPHYFRFMDATFQAWLRGRGLDQETVRERWEAPGTGLLDAGATFRAPVADGDTLRHEMAVEAWEARSVRLSYRGLMGDRLAVEGHETRGLFHRDPARGGRLTLAEIEPLRREMEG